MRLDQNVGTSDRLFFKYSFDDTAYITARNLPPPANAASGVSPYFSADGTNSSATVPLRNQSVTLNYVKVIGPSTVNEVAPRRGALESAHPAAR